jgi:hypothetical protein
MNFSFGNTVLGKTVIGLILASFLWIGAFGLMCHMGKMENSGMMNSCLFNPQESMCTMDFSEVVALWQGMFAGLQQDLEIVGSLLMLVVCAFVAVIILSCNFLYEFSERLFSRWRLYLKQYFNIQFFSALREAFSQGILNPKVFELAV